MSTVQERCRELLPVIRAGAEGKTIQASIVPDETMFPWEDVTDGSHPAHLSVYSLRVKPELKYRPFTHMEMAGHIGNKVRSKSDARSSGFEVVWGITGDERIILKDCCYELHGFAYLLKFWEFTDGTPCGVLVD